MRYERLFKKLKTFIHVAAIDNLQRIAPAELRASSSISIYNLTDREIWVAFRDGRIQKLKSSYRKLRRTDYTATRNGELDKGIHIVHDYNMPNQDFYQSVDDLGVVDEDKRAEHGIGLTNMLAASDYVAKVKAYHHRSEKDPEDNVQFFVRSFYSEDELASLGATFYDQETDLAFCMSHKYAKTFLHPYSSRSMSSPHVPIPVNFTDDTSIFKDRVVTFSFAYISDNLKNQMLYFKPFDGGEIHYMPVIRMPGLKGEFILFYENSKLRGATDSIDNFDMKKYTLEEFGRLYPYFKLFKNYNDAQAFDPHRQFHELSREYSAYKAKHEEENASHANAMERIKLERLVIEDKVKALELAAEQRNREHEDQIRRKEEVFRQEQDNRQKEFDSKLETLAEELQRTKLQNEELHKQKTMHKEAEFKQSMEREAKRAKFDDKVHRRKTWLDFIKSIPSALSSIASGILGVLKLVL